MMTTNSCAAHAVYRESQTPYEDIHPSRAAGDAVLEFGRFRLLLRRRQLIADGVPIGAGSRVLDLLLALIEADGSLVTKSELLRRVWPGIVVAEDNLKVQIAALRKALGKDRDFISTEFGRGYRFTAAVRAVAWNTCQWPTFGGSQTCLRLRARWISRPPHARRALRSVPATH